MPPITSMAIPSNMANYYTKAEAQSLFMPVSASVYTPDTTYPIGWLVVYNNNMYKSLQDNNIGNAPDLSPSYWVIQYTDIITQAQYDDMTDKYNEVVSTATQVAEDATTASTSATSATASATSAATSASEAASDALIASSEALNSEASAISASTSAANALSSSTNALTSETNSANSAIQAGLSEISALNAANSATLSAAQAQTIKNSILNVSTPPKWVSGNSYNTTDLVIDEYNLKTYIAQVDIPNSTVAPHSDLLSWDIFTIGAADVHGNSVLISLRFDLSTNWTSNNPILSAGEVGVELNTGKFKIGNAIDNWATLTYATDWSKITNAPTTAAGYGITDIVSKVPSTDNVLVRFNGATGDVQNGKTVEDDKGNIGINNTTPSTWSGTVRAIEGVGGSFFAVDSAGFTYMGNNAYFDGTNWRYKNTGTASLYTIGTSHIFKTAISGVSGSVISWVTKLTTDATGTYLNGSGTTVTADLALKAPLASPSFSGTPTAPTAPVGDSSTKLATTSFVSTALQNSLVSPAFSGTPTAPTPTTGDSSTKLATTSFVSTALQNSLVSPAFSGTPTAPTPTTGDSSTKLATTAFVKNAINNTIEITTSPILGLLYNATDDAYKRIGKNINPISIDGMGEFSGWKSPTSERQNDADTASPSPLTAWLDTTPNLPYSRIGRYVIDNTGAEVKKYNADSYTHADQTGITTTQQVMCPIPLHQYISARIVDSGKTYFLYMVAKNAFTVNAITDLGFVSPTITVWNPTKGVSSGTVAANNIASATSLAHVASSGILPTAAYGAFNAVNGRSICGSGVKATGNITRAQARTQCQAFGANFNQIDFFLESTKNILVLIERGSFYMERGGASMANKWEGYSWNSGASSNDQDNGKTLSLGDKTGVILDGYNRTIANSWRGIENYHSALWRWVDGVNLDSNVVYLAKKGATFDDTSTTTNGYFSSGVTVPSASASYISDLGAGTFIPTAVAGSATTKMTDGAWTGSTTLCVGGSLAHPSTSGVCAWVSNGPASSSGWGGLFVARPGL